MLEEVHSLHRMPCRLLDVLFLQQSEWEASYSSFLVFCQQSMLQVVLSLDTLTYQKEQPFPVTTFQVLILLNLKYENDEINIVAGYNYAAFSLDKSKEKEWEKKVMSLLEQKNIEFDIC